MKIEGKQVTWGFGFSWMWATFAGILLGGIGGYLIGGVVGWVYVFSTAEMPQESEFFLLWALAVLFVAGIPAVAGGALGGIIGAAVMQGRVLGQLIPEVPWWVLLRPVGWALAVFVASVAVRRGESGEGERLLSALFVAPGSVLVAETITGFALVWLLRSHVKGIVREVKALIAAGIGSSLTLIVTGTLLYFVMLQPSGSAQKVKPSTPFTPQEVKQLQAAAGEGMELVQLTSSPGSIYIDYYVAKALAWSPDGGKIAFEKFGAPGREPGPLPVEVWVMDVHNRSQQQIADVPPYPRVLGWTSEGSQIVLEAGSSLWVVPAQGGEPRQLSLPVDSSGAAPRVILIQGTRIFFEISRGSSLSARGEDYLRELWLVDLDRGTEIRMLMKFLGGGQVSLSPDGGKLAWSGVRLGSPEGVWVRNVDGSGERQIWQQNVLSLDWSPDGSRIAFLSRYGNEVWLINADGTGEKRLATLPKMITGDRIKWSPDGGKLGLLSVRHDLYVSRSRGAGLWVVNLGSGSLTPLLTPRDSDESRFSIDRFAWSPDGSRIALVLTQYQVREYHIDLWPRKQGIFLLKGQ